MFSQPVGLNIPRSMASLDVSTSDYVNAHGFMLYAGGAGNVTARAQSDGSDVAFSVAAGDVWPVVLSAVRSSGTTATGLIALKWS